MPVIFSESVTARRGVMPPASDVPHTPELDDTLQRQHPMQLCACSEPQVVRHYTALSRKNHGVDTDMYPLGSCTMKYNPKVCENVAVLPGFSSLHPVTAQLSNGARYVQGALWVLDALQRALCEITAMAEMTLQPLAGAHGELTGMMCAAAYHRAKGNHKTHVLIPDEAHGTNPSSAARCGYDVVAIPTDPETGMLDLDALRRHIDDTTAAVMVTNPNTLGIFNSDIDALAHIAHEHDALVYYDGANLNATLGRFRPGDAGLDIVHLNLHKTFATPHGGGGPGAGPVGVCEALRPFLPVPRIIQDEQGGCVLCSDYPQSIGSVAPFYGNFGVCIKALAYIYLLGGDGLRDVSEHAVRNANYVMERLKDIYTVPYGHLRCMHEFVISAVDHLQQGIHAQDIAKALIDKGIHPPTVYFPLIVKEALMVEPTETESKETLDRFIRAMRDIAATAQRDPQSLQGAPYTTPVGRLDEKKAAKDMDFCFQQHPAG
jgi:glycine dehydrogenase subunit 2